MGDWGVVILAVLLICVSLYLDALNRKAAEIRDALRDIRSRMG